MLKFTGATADHNAASDQGPSTQIQYSEKVMLNFDGLTSPHVSVATLVPVGAVPIPPTAWTG